MKNDWYNVNLQMSETMFLLVLLTLTPGWPAHTRLGKVTARRAPLAKLMLANVKVNKTHLVNFNIEVSLHDS